MTAVESSFWSRYWRMAGMGLVAGGVAVALGYFPTLRLGGADSVPAMLAGASVAVVAGWFGALLVCRSGGDAAARVNRMLGATATRLAAAVVLTLVVALSGWFRTSPLLLWVAVAYVATLAAETILFVRWAKTDPMAPRPQSDVKEK